MAAAVSVRSKMDGFVQVAHLFRKVFVQQKDLSNLKLVLKEL